MTSDPFDNQTLRQLVRPLLPGRHDTLRLRSIATGKHNESFWVENGPERFVLRIAPADTAGFLFYERLMMRQEPGLHRLIRANTTIPVAEVVGYDFSRSLIDRDLVLMAALPGTPLSDMPGLSTKVFNRALQQTGQHLRQLHDLLATEHLAADLYGYLGEHRPMPPQPTWYDAFRVMWHKLLDDVVACGAYSTDEAQGMRDLLELHGEHFTHPVSPRLLHMDVWSQNILIDKAGNVTGLVDFDRALWGDVEIEFAVLDYCGISEPPFWEGYGQARDSSQPAQIRRQFYLLYEVQKYMPIRVWRRNDPAGAERYKRQSFQLAAQLVPGEY